MLPHRTLGCTGLSVSVLGYGASPLGGVFSGFNEEEGIRSVHAAFAAGINFFDTSPYYGAFRSEKVLGRALQGLPRHQVVLSTKVGRYGPDQKDFDFSASRVAASVNESLERLQTSYIDLIQCHDIEFGDLDQIVTETIPELNRLREQGLIKYIGITGLPLKSFRYVLDRVPHGSVDVVLSYCHYCLVDDTLAELLPYLEKKGVGVINASPLSMGLLTPQGPPDWHPAPTAVKEVAKAAAQAAKERGGSIATLGLMEAVKNPRIVTTLVGMPTCEQVKSNVDAVLRALRVEEDPNAAADAEVLAVVQKVLAPVKNTTWPSGRPENN